jgi:hypothetical protein
MTLVLSYDPSSQITSGFFGYTRDEGDDIISALKKSAHLTLHPLLIPALIHSTWFKIMSDQYSAVTRRMRQVQKDTGLLNDYLGGHAQYRPQTDTFLQLTPAEHNAIHKTLIEQHAYLTTALSDFVGNMGPSTAKGLAAFDEINPVPRRDYGLPAYVSHWNVRVGRELEHREQLLKRVDVQIQVVGWTMICLAGSKHETVLTETSCIC